MFKKIFLSVAIAALTVCAFSVPTSAFASTGGDEVGAQPQPADVIGIVICKLLGGDTTVCIRNNS
jgi:hypothetical protein